MFEATTGTFAANKVMRELCKSGAIGYTELAKTIKVTYDQYQNSTAPVKDGMKYVKISDSPLPLDRITEFTMHIDPALAEELELPERVVRHSEEFEFENAGGYMQALLIDELVVMQSVHENAPGAGQSVGFHVLAQVDDTGKVVTWFTDFKFGEDVIHPIDPKYLPGAVLPVVELETPMPNGTEPAELSAADSAKMDAILAAGSVPFMMKMKNEETGFSAALVMSGLVIAEAGIGMFSSVVTSQTINLTNADGAWVVMAV